MSNRDAPHSTSRNDLLASLRTIVIEDSEPGALAGYVEQDMDRFLLTYNLANIPAHRALEIGANPYFLTLMLRWFRPNLHLDLINFFGGDAGRATQNVSVEHAPVPGLATSFELEFANADIETQPLPYDDGAFELIFFCEVFEHFVIDPFHALIEIRRCLKKGGRLVMSTPNVARMENIARILVGHNVQDQYSGHGPHGRHNREYTRHEIAWLLRHLGFTPLDHFTADVHPIAFSVDLTALPVPAGREHDLGQYQFHLWEKSGSDEPALRPAWLYRSMQEELDSTPL